MALSTYKQWSGKTRAKMSAQLKGHKDRPKVTDCEICGQSQTTKLHAEEYGPEWQDYIDNLHSLCARCHGMLHLRFRFPNKWKNYLADCAENGPQKPIKHVGILFGLCRGWEDDETASDFEGDEWFHELSTKRFKGKIL